VLSSRESDFFLEDWRVRPQLNVLESPVGQETPVEAKSMEVLVCLARHHGKVVRKARLMEEVWVETFVSDDRLTHAIWELRKALGDDSKKPRFIQTVPRRGYRLVGRVNRLDATPPADVWMIGPYRVGEKLGGGAMGVVHRAEDTRLGRPVALKFLAPELVRDPEAHARFLREARAASGLDHPGICTVYDIGETDEGGVYLAMAHYEGGTLKQRLARGPLSLEEALEVAAQIAEALAAAHAKGIVHRDLKPANVMLTSEGRAKLLDFGLAKLLGGSQLTRAGRPLGTPAYMAPEQARGEAIDHRVDLWALGVVLYQMLSGKLPFGGEDSNAILYAITHEEPLPLEAAADLPPRVIALLEQLLRKEPDQRYADSAALADALRGTPVPGPTTRPGRPEERRRPKPMPIRVATGVALLVLAAVALGYWLLVHRRQESPPVSPASTPFTTDGGWKDTPRLSPDGERVAYAWRGPTDDLDIYFKALGQGAEPLRLTDDPGEEAYPVFSPDGRQLAFVRLSETGSAIYVIPSYGGREWKVTDLTGEVPRYPALSWSPDGRRLAFSEQSATAPARIVALSLETLEKEALTSPPAGIGGDFSPQFSPDGRQVAFCRRLAPVWGDNDIWIQPEDGEARPVTSGRYEDCGGLAWSTDGREVLFSLDPSMGNLVLRVSVGGGTPQPVAGVGISSAAPSIVEGRMVYRQTGRPVIDTWRIPGRRSSADEVTPERLIASSRADLQAVLAPDGSRIAFSSYRSGVGQIWLVDRDGSRPYQLTNLEKGAGTPAWSPDGHRIAFDSLESGNYDLWVVDAAGGIPQQLTFEASDDGTPSWSRDGRWVYFHSNRGGPEQIWKIPADGGEAVQVTRKGGFFARESPDGRTLYFYRVGPGVDERSLWRMPSEGGNETRISGAPVDLWMNWDVSRSGIYFLVPRQRSRNLLSLSMGRRTSYSLRFLDLATGRVSEHFRREGVALLQGLTVSPDEEWILYAEVPAGQAELVLVENFR
jgi:serine/threonine protein kinase/WD40 repeat protein